MIRIKFEVEEQEETPLPIENENERIKRILSLKFFGNNLNNSTSDNTNNNVSGILKPSKKSPEKNSVVPKKKPKLVNSTTNSVVAVGSKSIKTEPAESSLSLTTQLNNSLNIQSLLRQNRIQNGWTTNEQSIPNGTQQQQQQSFLSTKIEPTVPENYQEVPLSLDLNSLISNLNSEESVNCDTAEIPFLVLSDSIPIGTQQHQQSCLALPKIESIVPENHQDVPLSLDQSSSWIPNLNLNSWETTTTNFDTTREFLGSRASLGRRAKLNVCHSVPKEPEPTPEPPTTITTTIQRNSAVAGNSESTNNDDNYSDQHSIFGFGSISGVDSSSSTAPSLPPEAAVPLLVRKKPLPLGIPPLTSLEEKKARQRERNRISYLRQKTNLKLMDLEAKAEIRNRKREYHRGYMQQLMANATPEQREQRRLKQLEAKRRQMENETEEQRKLRLEQKRNYYRKVDKQRMKQKRQTVTPEEREKKRSKKMESYRRQLEKESEEHRKQRLERLRQYYIKVGKRRRQQKWKTMTPEEREKKRANNTNLEKQMEFEQTSMSSETSFNLVVDNSGKSSTTSTKKRKPRKKRYELSMSIFDSDSSNFDDNNEDWDIDCETTNTLVESPKPGPSKLPDRSARRCQSNLKSNKYLEPSTDYTDSD